jgi:hypothetical protein
MTRKEKLEKMLTSGYIIRSSIDLVGFASACALASAGLPYSMLSSSSKPASDADVASNATGFAIFLVCRNACCFGD